MGLQFRVRVRDWGLKSYILALKLLCLGFGASVSLLWSLCAFAWKWASLL
jgi:hypothetical protein